MIYVTVWTQCEYYNSSNLCVTVSVPSVNTRVCCGDPELDIWLKVPPNLFKMMSESNGMKTHPSVTVTTDPGPAPQSLEIRLNIGYFKTAQGIVKLVQLVRFYVQCTLYSVRVGSCYLSCTGGERQYT